jgi:hypothetical protein
MRGRQPVSFIPLLLFVLLVTGSTASGTAYAMPTPHPPDQSSGSRAVVPQNTPSGKKGSPALRINSEVPQISYLDLGGGMGISYSGEPGPTPDELADVILPLLEGYAGDIILEPGRSIVGDAGALLTTALYYKPSSPRSFLVVDASRGTTSSSRSGRCDFLSVRFPCLRHCAWHTIP